MNRARNTLRRALIAVSACLALAAVAVPPASANLEFSEVGVSVDGSDGQFLRQAGGHPDFTFSFAVPLDETDAETVPVEAFRDIELELPPGLVGNPTSFPTCTMDLLVGASFGNVQQCPASSQVGKVTVTILNAGGGPPSYIDLGLFNIAHGPEVPAKFGFNYLGYVATITPQVRPGDHGISAGSFEISRTIPVSGAELTFWAYPADSSHDFERQGPGIAFNVGIEFKSSAPNVPFFTNPHRLSGCWRLLHCSGRFLGKPWNLRYGRADDRRRRHSLPMGRVRKSAVRAESRDRP